MTSIREIFSTFGPEYLQRYATTMPKTHRKVIDAIIACRTEACGIAFYQCEGCAEPQQFFVSCGNRHCPTCQYNKSQQWLQTQIQRQLPGHHFLITFTVPEQLRSFMRQNQRAVLLGSVQGVLRGNQKTRPRSKAHRWRSPRLLRCAAHLGTNSSVPSPHPLRRFGWRYPFMPMALGILPESISFSPSKLSRSSSEPSSAI